ncbi:MAG TPA: hypothetical protein VGA99_02090 [bacterium]
MTRDTLFSTTALLVLASLTAVSAMQTGSKFKRYTQKNGTIEYTITGNMMTGTEALYFDEFGLREAKYTNTEIKMGSFSQKTNSVAYVEGSTIYTVDLNTNTGTKMENSMMKKLEGKDLQDAGKQMLVEMGGKQIGNETFLGKNCEVWEIKNLGSKSWIWNGLMLKTEVNMMGQQVTYTATKISDTFDAKKLQRPTNINYTEGVDPMKMLEQMKKNMPKN